jgi:O-antigen ligase
MPDDTIGIPRDPQPPVERVYTDSRRQRVRRISTFERVVLVHFGVLFTATAWNFGGQSPSARAFLLGWGTLGIALFVVAAWLGSVRQPAAPFAVLRWLWPLALFDFFVGLSCLNPTFRQIMRDGEAVYVMVPPPHAWLPSSARPVLTLRELWLSNGIVLSCACLYLTLQSRRAVRVALYVMATNGLILAVFGTFQKLLHAKGLWFGLVESPQPLFFSTFVYHNHWGAFTLLNTAVCLALLFYFTRQSDERRDIWHSPALSGAVATLLLAASAPLSASRSSTILIGGLLLAAFVHFLLRVVRHRRRRHESAVLPVVALTTAVLLAGAGIFFVSRQVVTRRYQLTLNQIADASAATSPTARLQLYSDTCRMASEKPWFGWGLETYANVFVIYNTLRPVEPWFPRPFYAEAHSDWLQSFAEVGVVGTALLVLFGLLPLRAVRWRQLESILPRYLLAGCGLALVYAWLEFPFANPSVMIAFWACYFSALRYAQLDQRPAPSPATPNHA